MSKKPAKKSRAPKAKKVAAVAVAEPIADPRAAAIATSWKDADVKAARLTKNRVKVGRVTYRSTRDAFTQLGLPPGACIGFRGRLKAAGKLAYTAPDGSQTMFTIVKE